MSDFYWWELLPSSEFPLYRFIIFSLTTNFSPAFQVYPRSDPITIKSGSKVCYDYATAKSDIRLEQTDLAIILFSEKNSEVTYAAWAAHCELSSDHFYRYLFIIIMLFFIDLPIDRLIDWLSVFFHPNQAVYWDSEHKFGLHRLH